MAGGVRGVDRLVMHLEVGGRSWERLQLPQ